MKSIYFILGLVLTQVSCAQTEDQKKIIDSLRISNPIKNNIEINTYYQNNKGNTKSSISKGSVSKGTLINGKLFPFNGVNFMYFDKQSYLSGRAFLNDKVLKTILFTYKEFEVLSPNKIFYMMECSHEHGGKLFPHRTHQNGLSVDFMMPLIKHGESYTFLDTIGSDHYFLEFDNQGRCVDDTIIKIDFNLVAYHILELNKSAAINGMKIKKVIINTNLKDELFATKYGKILKSSGIYIVQKLSPLINSLHDDHYHIDFESK